MQCFLQQRINYPEELLFELFFQKFPKGSIPGIVRRQEFKFQKEISVGFVSPNYFKGERMRIPAMVKNDEIIGKISPYELPFFNYNLKKAPLNTLREISELHWFKTGGLGVFGSVALEIATGASFVNLDSDLDILIKGFSFDEIIEVYKNIARIGINNNTVVDLEIDLSNGYGVKAKEVLSKSRFLLGKSISSVELLTRTEVLKFLGNN